MTQQERGLFLHGHWKKL